MTEFIFCLLGKFENKSLTILLPESGVSPPTALPIQQTRNEWLDAFLIKVASYIKGWAVLVSLGTIPSPYPTRGCGLGSRLVLVTDLKFIIYMY